MEALVIGTGPCWRESQQMNPLADRVVVNRAAFRVRRFCHWVSHYFDTKGTWWLTRACQEGIGGFVTHGPRSHPLVDIHWPQLSCQLGTSGLLGVLVALGLGYTRVILAGIPLLNDDGSKRFDRKTYAVWEDFARTEDAKRVRSLSGWTRHLLGAS